MTGEQFSQHAKNAITFLFAVLGFLYATVGFVRGYIYVKDDLEVSAIGDVPTHLPPNERDQISLRLAVVNAGTRDAAEGVWIKSMDSKGRLYTLLYTVSQYNVPNDIMNGPITGYTFDCHSHQLFVDLPERVPDLAKKYDGDVDYCH